MTSLQETALDFEAAWWNGCSNTFGEEAKQLTYAPRMGLVNEPRDGKWPVYDLKGATVLDLGGGPVSMLLKCVGGNGAVVDPCPYPEWVAERYAAAEIGYHREPAETFTHPNQFSEAWIYNVLQHVEDPEQVVATARRQASVVRVFEWIEMPPSEGHPHTLRADDLNDWVGGTGSVEHVDENGATGLCWYGVFG